MEGLLVTDPVKLAFEFIATECAAKYARAIGRTSLLSACAGEVLSDPSRLVVWDGVTSTR
jgi:hypothetical protein